MEVNRYLRKDKVNQAGYAPIRISVIPFKKRVWLETGEKVRPKGWDERKQRVKGTEDYYTQINDRLDQWVSAAEKVYRACQKDKNTLNETQFKEAVKKEMNPTAVVEAVQEVELTFFQHMDHWILLQTNKISDSRQQPMAITTIRGHNATKARLLEFEKHWKKPLTFQAMDAVFYQAFKRYMLVELVPPQSVNTFSKHVTRLKRFLQECVESDLPVNPKYQKFSMPTSEINVEALTLQELQALQNIDFASDEALHFAQSLSENWYRNWHWQQRLEVLERTRDVFLMMCYTGLRISDMSLLTPGHITGDIIEIRAKKTGGLCYIPFYDDDIFKPVSLMRKYQGKQLTCLPVFAQVNRYLKEVQRLANVNRFPLKTKNGRKTFVTLRLYQGIPTRVIMQATGHRTESSFNHYAGINTKELVNNFQKHSVGVQFGVQI